MKMNDFPLDASKMNANELIRGAGGRWSEWEINQNNYRFASAPRSLCRLQNNDEEEKLN